VKRFFCPSLGIADRGAAFSEGGQHLDRQALKSLFPVGVFFS
jgi:hypothetical protein